MNNISVAILGCGPAGLMACHAGVLAGFDPKVYSIKQKSKMFGAMYLHKPIPKISPTEPEFVVDVIKTGTREGYGKLVYNDERAPVSWDHIRRGPTPAWSLTGAYNKLWQEYADRIVDWEASPETMSEVVGTHDVIISSIPAHHLCYKGHIFESQGIRVLVDPKPNEFHLSLGEMMYYNGYPPDGSQGMIGPEWYRFSQIGGMQCWEYSAGGTSPNEFTDIWGDRYIVHGKKPLATDCTCFPSATRVGRFGEWKKGVLTHHAFNKAEDLFVRVREEGIW